MSHLTIEDEIPLCCICYKINTELVMLPCNIKHIVCVDCYVKIERCPVCRNECNNSFKEKLDKVSKELDDKKYECIRLKSNNKLKESRINDLEKEIVTLKHHFNNLNTSRNLIYYILRNNGIPNNNNDLNMF